MDLKLYHWNCNSLPPRKIELKKHLDKYQPDIVALQETFYKPNITHASFNSYVVERKDRPDGIVRAGGLSLLIHDDLSYITINFQPFQGGFLEIQGITIILKQTKLDIINIYRRPEETLRIREFMHYFRQIKNKYVICGDFNAHSAFWEPDNPEREETNGKNLIDILLRNDRMVLATPPGLPT